VLHPSLESLGWLLPCSTAIGALRRLSGSPRPHHGALLFVIALQALTLFIDREGAGRHTPYMAFKMVYLAIYPMAVLGAWRSRG
jgi:hypothetical protein